MTSEAPSTDLTTEQSTSEGPANSTETEGSTDYSDAGTISIESSTLEWNSSDSTTENLTAWPTTKILSESTQDLRYYDWLEHTNDDEFDKSSNDNDWIHNYEGHDIDGWLELGFKPLNSWAEHDGRIDYGYQLIIVWNVFNWCIVYWNYERRFIKRKHWLIDRFNRIDRLLSGLDWLIDWFDRVNLIWDYRLQILKSSHDQHYSRTEGPNLNYRNDELNPIDLHSLAEDHNHNDNDHRNYGPDDFYFRNRVYYARTTSDTSTSSTGTTEWTTQESDATTLTISQSGTTSSATCDATKMMMPGMVCSAQYPGTWVFADTDPAPTLDPYPCATACPQNFTLFNDTCLLVLPSSYSTYSTASAGCTVYRNCPFVAAAPMAFFVYYMALSYATQYDDMLASIISFAASMVYSAITGGQAIFTRSPTYSTFCKWSALYFPDWLSPEWDPYTMRTREETRAKFRPDQAVKAAKKAAKERADREQAELEAIEAYNDDLKARKLFWRLMERWTFKQVHRRDQMSALWDKFVREVVNFDSVDVKEMEDRLDLAPFTSLVAWLTYVPPRHQRVTAVHREELVRDNGQFGGRRFDRPEEILLDEQIDKFWGGVEEYEEERQQQWLPVYDDDAAFTRWLGTEHEEAARFKPKEACPDPELPNRSINPRNRPVDIYWLNDARPGFIGPKRQQMVELGPWDGFVRKALHTQNAVDLEWEPVWAQHVFERDREANGPHPYDSFVLGQDWFWNEPQCMQTGNMYMGI
ncbi:unnamed protein product, partial [Mesorhabditis spiculigera]